jgi:hypothetical protein
VVQSISITQPRPADSPAHYPVASFTKHYSGTLELRGGNGGNGDYGCGR